jgi:hypothetical protein
MRGASIPKMQAWKIFTGELRRTAGEPQKVLQLQSRLEEEGELSPRRQDREGGKVDLSVSFGSSPA